MATFILAIHFLIIVFILAGFPLVLRLNHRMLRFIHSGTLVFITLLMMFGLPCPLTILEETLTSSSYDGSFLAYWLHKIIYLEGIDASFILPLAVCFTVLVFSSYIWHPVKKK